MPSLTLYLLRQMTVAAAMTASGLTFAIWLSQSLRLLDIIVNRGLSIGLAIEFLALLLPSLFALLLPIAVFIAVMVVYLRMNSDSELVVMRNAGISNMGLARPAILFGLATTAITYGLTLYGIPLSMRSYHDIQRDSASSMAGVLVEAGVFTDIAPGVTFFAQSRDRSGGLGGIIVNDTRDQTRSLLYTAERGLISPSADGPHAILENGTYQETNPKTGQVSVLYFDHTSVGLGGFFGQFNGPRRRASDELFLGELWNGSEAGKDLDARWRLRVEAHRRLVDPTYCLALAMLAAACLIAGGQPRQGYNMQVITATLLAAVVMVGAFMLRGITEGTDTLAPLVYAVPIATVIASLRILTRNRPLSRAGAR
jgi:lipopolysaccharide export system permease protein